MANVADQLDASDLKDLVGDIRVAMVTTGAPGGELHARPLSVQRVDADGTVWFLVARDADWVRPDGLGQVNASFVGDDRWVSVAGRADLVQDRAVLDDLGDPVSDAWFGDDHPPVALKVSVEQADVWKGPGRLSQLFRLGKAAITQEPPDMGERAVVRGEE
jgi:general stress protein 26